MSLGLLLIVAASTADAQHIVGRWDARAWYGSQTYDGQCLVTLKGAEVHLTCTFDDETSTGVGTFDPTTHTLTTSRSFTQAGRPGQERATLRLDDDHLIGSSRITVGSSVAVVDVALTRVTDDQGGVYAPKVDAPLVVAGIPVHLGAEATFDMFAFSSSENFESADTVSYDLSARRNQLVYDVDPIFVLGASALATLELDGQPLELSLGYRTSRLFGSRGSVSTHSTGPLAALGVDAGVLTDILDLVGQLAGLRGHITVARFAPGTARLTGEDVGIMPVLLTRITGELGYEHEVRGTGLRFGAHLRFEDYSAPRIVYELLDEDPDPDVFAHRLVGETPPLLMRSRTLGPDFTIAWDPFRRRGWHVTTPLGLRLGLGAGLLSAAELGDPALFVFRAGGHAGVAVRYLPLRRGDPRFELTVRVEHVLYAQSLWTPGPTTRVLSTDDGWTTLSSSVSLLW